MSFRLRFPQSNLVSVRPQPIGADQASERSVLLAKPVHANLSASGLSIEPQSQHYLVHGDLWDFLYLQSLQNDAIFLPLTLEMGSWRWIRKNPLQLRQLLGLYHPIKPHRLNRVLRSHLILMEFLLHATLSYQNWLDRSDAKQLEQQALALWYP